MLEGPVILRLVLVVELLSAPAFAGFETADSILCQRLCAARVGLITVLRSLWEARFFGSQQSREQTRRKHGSLAEKNEPVRLRGDQNTALLVIDAGCCSLRSLPLCQVIAMAKS